VTPDPSGPWGRDRSLRRAPKSHRRERRARPDRRPGHGPHRARCPHTAEDSAGSAPATNPRISPTDIDTVTLARTLAEASRRRPGGGGGTSPPLEQVEGHSQPGARTPACADADRSPRKAWPQALFEAYRRPNAREKLLRRTRRRRSSPSSARSEPGVQPRPGPPPSRGPTAAVGRLGTHFEDVESLATTTGRRWRGG
jgi:hypothetical protein